MSLSYNEVIKECRSLAKQQNLVFQRSKTVSTLQGKACYEISSGIQSKVLKQGNLMIIWENLLSGSYANQ